MKNLVTYLLLLAALLLGRAVRAQSVGIGTATPDASAALEVAATARGLLVPRLTQVQRAAIAAPAKGLLVFQTDGAQPGFWFNAGTPAAPAWTFFNPSADNLGNHTATQPLNLQGNALTGTGASVGAAVGLGVRADGGLNLGQNTLGNNLLLGYQAGATTTGTSNQFSGYQSGLTNTSGSFNQFGGFQSGFSNTSGGLNQFDGYRSGFSNTVGGYNLFHGFQSGRANTVGSYNQFTGYASGEFNTSGNRNQFSGYASGASNTSGSDNQFSGYQSGFSNTTGRDNQFDGFQSGRANTTGSSNQFSGYQSGFSNTTGSENQFSGYLSGKFNTTGGGNQFSGTQSGFNNTSGDRNQFSGYLSGYLNKTGVRNHFDGYQSGFSNMTGSENTALGWYSGPASGSTGLNNTLALGSGASVVASNTIQLGNAAITALRCQVGLTVTSDARFKYAVRPDVPGLAFVTRLRPVTYRFDQAKLAAFERTGALPPGFGPPDPRAPLRSGFLAQDVEAAARALGYAFDGLHAPANARDHYGLDYAQFVVPLVQAVQEQQAQIAALQAQNAALQARAAADRAAAEAQATGFAQRLRALEAAGAPAAAAR